MKINRRTFIIGSLLVGLGGAGLGSYVFRRLTEQSELVVRTLCDRFIPGHDDVPGAVALGIDREILGLLRATRRGLLGLLALTRSLDGRGFFELGPSEQRTIIQAQLEAAVSDTSDPPSREAKTVDTIYNECVRRYLTHPDIWTVLAYRTPQPHGYPDYTRCSAS